MAFKFSDVHLEDYYTKGCVIFVGILPVTLIEDLRRSCLTARDIARQNGGPQVQRLQPVADYNIDQQPFKDYAELPELNDAISRLLPSTHTHGNPDFLGVLVEPADWPYCTPWHRDWRDNVPGIDLVNWESVFTDPRLFNQVNCALYDDSSTWIVPGSHLRHDLPREAIRFPDRPIVQPELEGQDSAMRERISLEYCRSMAGAVQLHLNSGDFALYRNTLWHMGNYVPYRQRATLHDAVDTPEFAAWREATRSEAARQQEERIERLKTAK